MYEEEDMGCSTFLWPCDCCQQVAVLHYLHSHLSGQHSAWITKTCRILMTCWQPVLTQASVVTCIMSIQLCKLPTAPCLVHLPSFISAACQPSYGVPCLSQAINLFYSILPFIYSFSSIHWLSDSYRDFRFGQMHLNYEHWFCSLLRNPVTSKKHYRLYVIHKAPQIRVLDFQKVKLKVWFGLAALGTSFSTVSLCILKYDMVSL